MRWRLAGKRRAKHAPARDAIVVSVTSPLTRDTAIELRRQVERADPGSEVVIDLTAIPAFDSDGADALFALQEGRTGGRVSIVGFRQAAARLVAPDAPVPSPPASDAELSSDWAVRRLRNLVIVQPPEGIAPTAAGLEATIAAAATHVDAAIIVLDLRGLPALPATTVDAIAFTSSSAALRGQELLVVNVATDAIEVLRAAGLSATTFVAPEPLGQPPAS